MKIEKLKIYSPISLLGRRGKIAEKFLYKAMLRFLSDSKFKSIWVSYVKQLLLIFRKISESLDNCLDVRKGLIVSHVS